MNLTPVGAAWPQEWRPSNAGTLNVEPFTLWWRRLKGRLPALHPQVYEQWVHKHWDYSPYFGLPLAGLTSTVTTLDTAQIVRHVGSLPGGLADPHPSDHTNVFNQLNKPMLSGVQPMHSMNATGTWNFPILVIRSSDGFDVDGRRYDSQLWLIEGHLRLRYFKALTSRERLAREHSVLELLIRAANGSYMC